MAATATEEVLSIPPPAERKAMLGSFDRLVESNFALQTSVSRLVRAVYVALAIQSLGVLAAAVFSALHR